MRLTLIISSLSSGGAERVLCFLANAWAERGDEVSVVRLDSGNESFFELNARVRQVALGVAGDSSGMFGKIGSVMRRCRAIRSQLRTDHPDTVVAFMDTINVQAVLSSAGLTPRIVISERTVPGRAATGWFWGAMRRITYPRADMLVVQTEGVRRWAERFVSPARVVKIPNPIEIPETSAIETLVSRSGPKLVAIGRLVKLKGFDRLIRSFAACGPVAAPWSLCVVGDGPERGALVELTRALGVAERVFLPGRVAKPSRFLPQFEFAASTSEYEGFPNAIGEAMAAGLPVVSFDCPYGPAEMIRHEVDGVLVPPGDELGLTQALERLMGDVELRRRMGALAREVTHRFGVEGVLAAWDAVIKGTGPVNSTARN